MKKALSSIILVFSILSMSAQSDASSATFGRNIVTISPIQVMVMNQLDANTQSDAGINISYERISSNEYFGFKLPVSFSLKNPYYYFMPALKIYPFGQGPVKFAFGPQFYIGTGEYEYNYYSYNYPYDNEAHFRKERTQVGFLINTSVNFSILQNLYMGLEAGLGINYFDSNADDPDFYLDNSYYNKRNNSQFYPAVQLNFSMGYRF